MHAAAALVRSRSNSVPPSNWDDLPWHVEPCANPQTGDCPCIVVQGDRTVVGKPGYPHAVEYIGDGETPEYARWIALMHLGIAEPLADWLESAARRQEATEQAAQVNWRGSSDAEARDRWVSKMTEHEALAVARALLGGES